MADETGAGSPGADAAAAESAAPAEGATVDASKGDTEGAADLQSELRDGQEQATEAAPKSAEELGRERIAAAKEKVSAMFSKAKAVVGKGAAFLGRLGAKIVGIDQVARDGYKYASEGTKKAAETVVGKAAQAQERMNTATSNAYNASKERMTNWYKSAQEAGKNVVVGSQEWAIDKIIKTKEGALAWIEGRAKAVSEDLDRLRAKRAALRPTTTS